MGGERQRQSGSERPTEGKRQKGGLRTATALWLSTARASAAVLKPAAPMHCRQPATQHKTTQHKTMEQQLPRLMADCGPFIAGRDVLVPRPDRRAGRALVLAVVGLREVEEVGGKLEGRAGGDDCSGKETSSTNTKLLAAYEIACSLKRQNAARVCLAAVFLLPIFSLPRVQSRSDSSQETRSRGVSLTDGIVMMQSGSNAAASTAGVRPSGRRVAAAARPAIFVRGKGGVLAAKAVERARHRTVCLGCESTVEARGKGAVLATKAAGNTGTKAGVETPRPHAYLGDLAGEEMPCLGARPDQRDGQPLSDLPISLVARIHLEAQPDELDTADDAVSRAGRLPEHLVGPQGVRQRDADWRTDGWTDSHRSWFAAPANDGVQTDRRTHCRHTDARHTKRRKDTQPQDTQRRKDAGHIKRRKDAKTKRRSRHRAAFLRTWFAALAKDERPLTVAKLWNSLAPCTNARGNARC